MLPDFDEHLEFEVDLVQSKREERVVMRIAGEKSP